MKEGARIEMACSTDSRTKGYRLASMIYDPVIERGMQPVRKKTLEISRLEPGDKVLDVCCGTGRQAEIFAETGADVCGVDLSDFMIDKARKKQRKSLTFIQADAAATGLDESSFDVASTGFSLHEVDEETRTGFLNEMARVTKPGGFLIFTDFSIQTRNGYKNRMRKGLAHSLEWLAGPEHYRNYMDWMRAGGLKGFLARKNLPVEKVFHMNGGHILIAKVMNSKSEATIAKF